MDGFKLMIGTMNSSDITCGDCVDLSPAFYKVYTRVYYAAYYIVMPVYLIVGLAGHLLCLIAFVKATKKETAYAYQVFVSVSQAAEVILYVLYVLSLKWWSGVENDSAAWFRNHYALVWYAAHLSTPLSNMCVTITLLLSLCMATDRFCALYRPYIYRSWNHKRNRAIGLITSVTLGILTSVFAVLRYQVVHSDRLEDGQYKVILDLDYASTPACVALSHVRNFVRMAALVLLIVCNTANLKLFRAQILKVGTESGTESGTSKETKRGKLEAERTLFILVTVESMLNSLGMTALTSYFFAIFTSPAFTKHYGLLMIPFVDVVLNLVNAGKFYVVLAVDRRFRRMTLRALSRKISLTPPLLAQGEAALQEGICFERPRAAAVSDMVS